VEGSKLQDGIAEAIRQVVCGTRCPEVRIGVVGGRFPFWRWCDDVVGKVAWTAVVKEDPDDPCVDGCTFLREQSEFRRLLRDNPVDVLLFEDKGPSLCDLVWQSERLQVVVWFDGS